MQKKRFQNGARLLFQTSHRISTTNLLMAARIATLQFFKSALESGTREDLFCDRNGDQTFRLPEGQRSRAIEMQRDRDTE